MPNPYEEYLEGRDPIEVLEHSLENYRGLPARISPAQWLRPWAPGKWTLQQIVVHVTQWEMIFGVRVRCALGIPDFVVQPLDQDHLMGTEDQAVSGDVALDSFLALRRMNLAFASALSSAQRRQSCQHRDRGTITLNDLLVTLAGHPVHHYRQIDATLQRSAG